MFQLFVRVFTNNLYIAKLIREHLFTHATHENTNIHTHTQTCAVNIRPRANYFCLIEKQFTERDVCHEKDEMKCLITRKVQTKEVIRLAVIISFCTANIRWFYGRAHKTAGTFFPHFLWGVMRDKLYAMSIPDTPINIDISK